MKTFFIAIALIFMFSCKKSTKAQQTTPTVPVAPPTPSTIHNYHVVATFRYPESPAIPSDTILIRINNVIKITQVGVPTLYDLKFNCKSGDRLTIRQNPGKDQSGKPALGGIDFYLQDTAVATAFQYSISIAQCTCVTAYDKYIK